MHATFRRASPTSRASKSTCRGWTAAKLVEACKERGVGIGANTATRIRAVTHLDVNRADIDTALKVISDALAA